MEKLLAYLNSLTTEQQFMFASKCGTSIGYLRKAISIGQKIGESICISIEQHSGGKVTCDDLRPDMKAQWDYLRSTCKKKVA